MTKRDDDLVEYVTSLEQSATKTKAKLDQRWVGRFAIPTKLNRKGIEVILAGVDNPRWALDIYDVRDGVWAIIDASYHAKGANADDATQFAVKVFGVDPNDVKIETLDVVLVGSRPDNLANRPEAFI